MDGATITIDGDGMWQLWLPGVDDGPAYQTTEPRKIEDLLYALEQQ